MNVTAAPPKAEVRITEPLKCELRVVAADNGPGTIEGHAAVFNTESRMMVSKTGRKFVERILPGAFASVLKARSETKALVDHDEDRVLARRSKGTLDMSEDDRGLAVRIALPNTQLGSDTAENVRNGNFDRMSFAFLTVGQNGDAWERRSDGSYLRTVKQVSHLLDVTVTDDRAAYPATDVYLRSIDAAIDELEKVDPAVERHVLTDEEVRDAERRATMTVEDCSLVSACRCGVNYFRYAFDSCNSIIDAASRVEGNINDDDQRAMDDCLDEIADLITKARAAKAALTMLGAEEEEDVGEQAATRMIATAEKIVKRQSADGELTPEARKIHADTLKLAAEIRRLKRVAGGKYVVLSEDGKKTLSKPMSKADALKRLGEIEKFKKADAAA